MSLQLDGVDLPADAVEVGRIDAAWGIKGWFKVHAYSASPEALFSSKRWYLQAPTSSKKPARAPSAAVSASASAANPSPGWQWQGTVLLKIREAKIHSDHIVAQAQEVDDRNAAECLHGARIFVPRSSFPTPEVDEYYWVDLIGLAVINRAGVHLGTIRDLMSTGPQTVLVIRPVASEGGETPNSTQADPRVVASSVPQTQAPQACQASPASRTPPAPDVLIPFVDAYIDSVSLAERCVRVDWDAEAWA